MFRIIKTHCPSNFINKFSYISGGSREGNNCNLYTNRSRTHKEFYYLGAKCWNIISHTLRDLDDVNKFSKAYKTQLLYSATHDQNYNTNNAFDHVYLPDTAFTADDIVNMPREIRGVLESLQSTNN